MPEPTSTETVTATLELAASEHPHLLSFLLEMLVNSPARSAVYELASAFDVSHEEVANTVYRASADLDRLEKRREAWHDPAKIVGAVNLAALFFVCSARSRRISIPSRQRRLQVILRRLERAYELARSRAWIEAFIGISPGEESDQAREAENADR